MRKIFAIVTVVLFAVSASAEVFFDETFSTRRGETYIVKAKTSSGEAWPFASQWFKGYEATDASKNVTGNQYDNDYTNVESYGVTIRGKKLNGSSEKEGSVGMYFAAAKAEKECYVKFTGGMPELKAAAYLHFTICPDQADNGDLDVMVVKVNDKALAVPSTALGKQLYTTAVTIPVEAGKLNTLYFAFNSTPAQRFIDRFWIDSEAEVQGIENIVITEKAQKVMVDGVVYIVRDGKMFDVLGTQVR